MKGLQGRTEFTDYLNSYKRKTLERLAEIEQEDADRCEGCGGEDCCCCEYYLDRQKWVSPDELFTDDDAWMYEPIIYDDEEEYTC